VSAVAGTTEGRLALHAALEAAGLPAFPYLPETVSPPCVIVLPDDPYVTPNRIGPGVLRYQAQYVVACVVQATDNETAVTNCEHLIDAVLFALPDGISASRVSRPSLDSLGAQGAIYVAEVTCTAQLERTP
jgi:hypothetical protein